MIDKYELVIKILDNLQLESNWEGPILYIKRKEGMQDIDIRSHAHSALMVAFGYEDKDVKLYG